MSACKRAGSPDGLRRFRYFTDRSLNGIALNKDNLDGPQSACRTLISVSWSYEQLNPKAFVIHMSALLDVENLVKTYGSLKAVDDLSFSVGAGEAFGLLGPNGAGKSTTMMMIAGVLSSDS